MRSLWILSLAVLFYASLATHRAEASFYEACAPVVQSGGSLPVWPTITATGLAGGAAYLILSQKDSCDEPVWHPLAHWLFGKDGRVGNEKAYSCP